MNLNELVDEHTTHSPAVENRESPPYANAAAAPQLQPHHVDVDDRQAVCSYANFCRVTSTPEELILDFGLNSEHAGVPAARVDVTQRLVVNYFTAKRMYRALQLAVQRHERAFGALEIDVYKRLARTRPETAGGSLPD